MALLKHEAIETARDLFLIRTQFGASPEEVKTEEVARILLKRYGILKYWKSLGAKKRHMDTALKKLFPNVQDWTFE